MKLLGKTLSWLVHVLVRRWFLLFTLFSLYYYHVVLDKDMFCSCTSLGMDCYVYLIAPGLVLFVVHLWVDLVFIRGLRLLCVRGVGGKVAPVLIKRLLEAGFVGLLWVQSVLLDGDWYLCCGRHNIMCLPKPPGISAPQIANESQVIGLLLVVLVTLTAVIVSCIPFGKCCRCPSDWPEAVLEETEFVMSQRLRKAAWDQFSTHVDKAGTDFHKWEALEVNLLLDSQPAETQRVQSTVHANPLLTRPTSRPGSNLDWGRMRPGQNQM